MYTYLLFLLYILLSLLYFALILMAFSALNLIWYLVLLVHLPYKHIDILLS